MTRNEFIELALKYYDVYEDGRIIRKGKPSQKPLGGYINPDGRKTVTLHANGIMKTVYAHRLVAAKFYGISDLTVNHKDGNPLNNHKDNLEYLTAAENQTHYWRTAANPRPSRTKISREIADKMRELYATGEYSQAELGRMHGLRDSEHIRNILKGIAWNH